MVLFNLNTLCDIETMARSQGPTKKPRKFNDYRSGMNEEAINVNASTFEEKR
jgi:hypothetical protein